MSGPFDLVYESLFPGEFWGQQFFVVFFRKDKKFQKKLSLCDDLKWRVHTSCKSKIHIFVIVFGLSSFF